MKTTTEIRASVKSALAAAIPSFAKFSAEWRFACHRDNSPSAHRTFRSAIADYNEDGICTGISIYEVGEAMAQNHYNGVECIVIRELVEYMISDSKSSGARAAREAAIDEITGRIVKHINSRENG